MGKNSNAVSDSETTVFVDTSLDTHFAIPVYQNDTVSALKTKIENEHQFCFTSMGKIKIEALKVERKGYFYHLSDSMLVKNAFIGVNDIWFISADASHVPGKKLSIADDSMTLLLEGKKCEQDKVTISEHNVSFDSAREASKELEIGFRHSDKDHSRTSVHEKIDRPEPEMQEDPNLLTGRFPTTQECKEDSSRKGSDVSCNASFGTDLPAQDKRQSKIKQKIKETVHSKAHDSFSYGYGQQQQQPDIIPPGNSLGNQTRDVSFDMKIGKETTSTRDVLCDMETGNKNTTKEPSRTSDSKIHVTDDTSKVAEVPGEHVKNRKNMSVEDAPRFQMASLKKRKFESVTGVEDSLKENNVLVSGSNDVTSKPEIALELALGAKRINANDLLGGLTAESSDMLSNSASQRKTKKTKKTSNAVNEVVSAAPSGRDVMEESSMVSGARINDKNSNGKDDAAETMSAEMLKENNVLVGGSNNGTSKPEIALELALGAKQINANDLLGGLTAESSDLLSNSARKKKTKKRKKTSNAVNQVLSASPSGRDVMEESSMVSGAGISEKNSDGKDNGASISGQGLQGVMPSESGRTEGKLDNCPSVAVEVPTGGGTNWAVRVGEERESSQIKDSDSNDTKVIVTSELLDANGNVGPDNKSKKKRKSKKSNSSIGESQIKSGTEHLKGSEHGIFSHKTHDAVHCEHAGHKTKEAESDLSQSNGKDLSEMGSLISHSVMRTDIDSIGKPQTNEESRKKNMKNKSKRIQSAETTNATDMQVEVGIVGPQDPVPTTENRTEVVNARRNTKSEKSSPFAQLNWKAHECDKDPAQSNSMVAESSKVPSHAVEHNPEKKFPKKVPSKAPSLDTSGKMISNSQAAGKHGVAIVSGNNTHAGKKNEAFAVSSSNLAKSNNKADRSKITSKSEIGVGRNRMATTKASCIDHGEVVNSSAKRQSSATPRAIFKDDSSGSSEDEDEGGISEASTDTPSDYSLSSGYSESESKHDVDSPRNGKASKGSVKKSCPSDIKNMNWLELAKNSSTFKKAKLTASQSELEDEIQPLDADSQPIS